MGVAPWPRRLPPTTREVPAPADDRQDHRLDPRPAGRRGVHLGHAQEPDVRAHHGVRAARAYTTGDDIRHLDWKVWSKTDRFYIKQYEAETNLRCNIVARRQRVDALRQRGAGQVRVRLHRRRLPRVHAVAPAGRGGLLAFDDSVRKIIPARSQMTHMDALSTR